MLKVKAGVVFTVLKPEIYMILPMIDAVFGALNETCVITSAEDGQHMRESKHYDGLALDLRRWNVEPKVFEIVQRLKNALGDRYDVILERDHIHLEFDPK